MNEPLIVEVTRGNMVESRHRAIVAVVSSDGALVESHGDIGRQVFARSAIKPIQSLGLLESGAADAFACSGAEIAIAAASHGGEPMHTRTVLAWLARMGMDAGDLECGAHMPTHGPSANELIRAMREPDTTHNNCSGKHTGMLAVCRHMGWPTKGYVDPAHPLQKRIIATYEEMLDVDLKDAPTGLDGCSLPQIGTPVRNLALGIARLGHPDALGEARAAACRRMAAAMRENPFMLAGTGRFCTRATIAARGRAIMKTGAEGVYMAAVPDKRIGIALKIEDGNGRGAEVALATLLDRYGGFADTPRAEVEALLSPKISNAAGRTVGEIRPAPNW
ncbi:MAG: asparaginase [Alphaproteobacteria bacterium]|nr:asparaginase [Alphaproteobacteria bacterium]